jgi:hypothetical protein
MSSTDVEPGQQDQAEKPIRWSDLISAGVTARCSEAGYVDDDGERDWSPLVHKLSDLVLTARVPSEREKAAKALSRGHYVSQAFPALPGPNDWQDEADPELAGEVYAWIERKVWDLLKSSASGEVQQEVGRREPGLLVCRAKLGTDHVWHAYVTDDLNCIKSDFNAPLARKVERANLAMATDMAMAVERLPQHVRTFETAYKSANKTALTAGENVMRPAIDAAKGDGGDDE